MINTLAIVGAFVGGVAVASFVAANRLSKLKVMIETLHTSAAKWEEKAETYHALFKEGEGELEGLQAEVYSAQGELKAANYRLAVRDGRPHSEDDITEYQKMELTNNELNKQTRQDRIRIEMLERQYAILGAEYEALLLAGVSDPDGPLNRPKDKLN